MRSLKNEQPGSSLELYYLLLLNISKCVSNVQFQPNRLVLCAVFTCSSHPLPHSYFHIPEKTMVKGRGWNNIFGP
jgi:hypothetical protein